MVKFCLFEPMNAFLKKLVPGLLLFACLGGPACAQTRLATVSLQKVFDNYWKTKQADAALKAQAADIDKSNKEMLDNYKKSKDEYQKLLESANDQAVSADERQKRQKAAEDKLRDIKGTEDSITQFQRQANATLLEKKSRMRKNILDEIKLAITGKAKSAGYSVVIDADAQTYVADPTGPYYMPTVLYTNGQDDITGAVITQLNAGAPVDITNTDDASSKPDGPAAEPKADKK
jgi:outer membrane protein